jgi:cell division transport system permease protein
MNKKVGISMRISTLGYVGKQGVKNIGRNKMFSLASVATMSACIFLFGLFFSILLNFQHIIKSAEEGVAITVFFDDEATQDQIDNIGEQLRSRDDVADVKFVSADDAWDKFKNDYFGDNAELADGFKNDNPLAGSDNYEVYMKTGDNDEESLSVRSKSLAATQQDLVKFAKSLDGVRKVNKSDVVANTLSSVNVLVGYVSIAIIIILFGVSIFLISNTVTMGITVRKEEIAIMKYIGAKDFVVRSPFVIEGLIMGLIGAIIPLALLYGLYGKAVEYVLTKFQILNNIINFLPVTYVYRFLLPIGLLLGVGIGFIGSYFTVRKHLKV